MKILMMTNTYTPLVGGLERSVKSFTLEYRRRGHRVIIVAPAFPRMPAHERDVIRIPALQRFNGSDFSVKLPSPPMLTRAVAALQPDIIHAHHPFLIGNTALRLAQTYTIPLVFTHHTLFEQYTHYLPRGVRFKAMERFVVELATGYANLCDQVIAPSDSVAALLRDRGVETPIEVIPTGVKLPQFSGGDRAAGRRRHNLPQDAFVIGHVGRLAPEKNLGCLAEAVAHVLRREPKAHLLIAGSGPSEGELARLFRIAGLAERCQFAGLLKGQALADAYHAMDVFAFTSKSETQGLVVVEAMAARVPVVALDAPGVRDVVRDRVNGRLVMAEQPRDLAAALLWVRRLAPARSAALAQGAFSTAESLSMSRCAERALALYARVHARMMADRRARQDRWVRSLRRIRAEWRVLKAMTKATTVALRPHLTLTRRNSTTNNHPGG